MKTVAVIIPTFKDYDWLIKCVNSVRSSAHLIRFYVIDNNIFNEGVAKAYNTAFKMAYEEANDYFLLLHTDVELYPDCLDVLVQELDTTGGYLLSGTEVGQVEWSAEGTERRAKQYLTYDPSPECFLISRKTVKDIGYFDENFYPYMYEFDDYKMRIKEEARILGDNKGMGRANHAVFTHHKHSWDEEWEEKNKFRFAQNKAYFTTKWGLDPGMVLWTDDTFVINRENQ